MIDITAIVNAFILLLAAVITVIVIPYIKSRTTAEQQAKLLTWVRVGVYAAEQIFSNPGMGEDKKNYVIAFLQDRGYTYNEEEVNDLIEAAVKQLNIEQGK